MFSFIALIDSATANSVDSTMIITNFLNAFVTGSAGSQSNNGGVAV
ncbi:hypothetical protein IU443_21965 [Nocardia farcinica]|uniref:Uncharacterized protein n=1 Tax=Nocardia farcinica TaxID=37329 RepID=A0A0H5P2L8_NOCFR|nr:MULTISPECIES: hypothetical protein [Nocardia]MBA4856729.1 hypothetical protein [Nocardia farcinica]MBC9818873.1 hypothetical protein [Nocardia farcinica]MBF6072858.1 hypothetical protein [Nocardia farcinica]MBF6188672.1 hypothetical protein [Nocardia farcinica]MBF6234457.1 hypothetical protein [Nocardia farcinica]